MLWRPPSGGHIFGLRLSRRPLRDVISHSIKCRRRIQKPLRPEMRFELSEKRVAFAFIRALSSDASFVIRRRRRSRAKFGTCESAQTRQSRPTQLVEHFFRRYEFI
jgi:hypothetical protein